MAGGYMGKVLWVDLSKGTLKDEVLDDKYCRDFIGGYGFGSRQLYSKMKADTDPLGPDAILGVLTGPFTGSPALCGTRFTVVCKSPLTGGWGDANCGGDFGPALKFAGYDGVYFTGASSKPVYLYIENGKAELKDAAEVWGKDSFDTEDILGKKHGNNTKVACIGPSGEKLSLISSVMHYHGRAAGRSGVGAVMGSKKLKAIAVNGNMQVPLANPGKCKELQQKYFGALNENNPFAQLFRAMGTPGIMASAVNSGDGPVKNWGGSPVDFPNAAAISDVNVIGRQEKKEACWHCPLGCGGRMKGPAEGSPYEYEADGSKPEYETLAAFGSMCLNDNVESIIKANDICNRMGLDTISAGVTISFAIECYENGLISKEDTGGIELTWGNHKAIVDMTEKLANGDGFGAVLINGVKQAAEKIGKGAEQYAIHVGGQEIPMHDGKLGHHYSTTYQMDATPARHTQGHENKPLPGLAPEFDPAGYTGRGEPHRMGACMNHLVNSLGMCLFGYMCVDYHVLNEFMSAITGWNITPEELVETGERIADLRHSFNLREGLNPLVDFKLPGRNLGVPPLKDGPLAGVAVDQDTMVKEYMEAMDWAPGTAKPSKARLEKLGLNDIAKDLWG